jgi:hypothetical protein
MSRANPPPIVVNDGNSSGITDRVGKTAPAAGSTRDIPSRILTPQIPAAASTGGGRGTPYGPYSTQDFPDSTVELLVPPSARARCFQPYLDSPGSSRRSSWSTDAGGYGDSRYGPFASSSDDAPSTAPSRVGSPGPFSDLLSMQTITEKYNITPTSNLLLYPNDKEDDDVYHDPATGMDNDRECDIFTKRGLVNVGGLALITAGVLILFIGYPVLLVRPGCVSLGRTFVRDFVGVAKQDICKQGDLCLDVGPRELLKNFRSSLIDPDTPASAKWRRSADGKPMKLVVGRALEGDVMTTLISLQFSDEFNDDGRTFYPNEDAYWYAEPFPVIYFSFWYLQLTPFYREGVDLH